MGTHAYLFCPTANMPTLREMFDWTAAKGYRLKLHAEVFDDDEEESDFLDENMDSTNWSEAPLADMRERWVVLMNHCLRNDPDFGKNVGVFIARVSALNGSSSRDRVLNRLNAARLFVDIQLNVHDQEVRPAQDAIMDYFFEHMDAIAYLENVGTFVQGQKILLKIGE